jgi:hypothetical protein
LIIRYIEKQNCRIKELERQLKISQMKSASNRTSQKRSKSTMKKEIRLENIENEDVEEGNGAFMANAINIRDFKKLFLARMCQIKSCY